MLALTVDAAKNIAIALVVIFVVGSILAAWILKTIIQKVAIAAVLALLAFAVYSQRTALDDCSDKVKANFERTADGVTLEDTECTFFNTNITISDPRDKDE